MSQTLVAQHTPVTSAEAKPAGLTPDNLIQLFPGAEQINRLSEVGLGKAIVFSPDFSAPGNREFYNKLGFAYFEDASWKNVLDQIHAHNAQRADKIDAVILETHGTNGHGLKLQTGDKLKSARSYISVGALRGRLQTAGVRFCFVAACNSGRLFRPEVYHRLNPRPGDPLFKPATLGIINSLRSSYSPNPNVIMARRADSEIEATNEGETSELSPVAQEVLGLRLSARTEGAAPGARALKFVVSNFVIQLLTRDPGLRLATAGFVRNKSSKDLPDTQSEVLFQKFLAYINAIAGREYEAKRAGKLAGPETPTN
ncbi:MAG TPA: hypothetical protein VKC34_17215 [Blastocatellia bacterium]|nr:hypothetical protein [Blastocatellia bacterium]